MGINPGQKTPLFQHPPSHGVSTHFYPPQSGGPDIGDVLFFWKPRRKQRGMIQFNRALSSRAYLLLNAFPEDPEWVAEASCLLAQVARFYIEEVKQITQPDSVYWATKYNALSGDTLTMHDDRPRPHINGREVNYSPPMAYASPYVSSEWNSGVIRITPGETEHELTFP